MLIADFEETVRAYAGERGLVAGRCPGCGKVFYTRRPRRTCEDVRVGCAPTYGFVGRRRGVWRPPLEVLDTLRARFARAGFRETTVGGMVGTTADTLFVIAGVQVFDEVLTGTTPPHREALFVPQPSVRVRTLERVGRRPAISSAFVNICSEEMDGDAADFGRHLDTWVDAFAGAGLDTDGLTLIVEPELFRRGRFEFRTVNVDYFGLELGEAIVLWSGEPRLRIFDFGFGLERIIWAANEADSYYTLIGPPRLALAGRVRLVDFVRTMTLLAAAGLRPGNNGSAYVLRKLGRLAAAEGAGDAPVDEIVRHCHRYWSAFVEPQVDAEACVELIGREIRRGVNATLAGVLGLNTNRLRLEQDTDAFLVDLVRRGAVGYGRLREALSQGGAGRG
jgi:hypothetical protein